MLFNSFEFILIFLPCVLISYYYINQHHSLRKISELWLIMTSLVFYGFHNVIYVPLILVLSILNYWIAHQIKARQRQASNIVGLYKRGSINAKVILIIGLSFNILVLCYFKYTNFLLYNLESITNTKIWSPEIVLPLAISFFMFQKIAYLVDTFKEKTIKSSFREYLLFVVFFPQLIAGPIVHHNAIVEQFSKKNTRKVQWKNCAKGLFLFSIGLFKKVVVADFFAIIANNGFVKASQLNPIEAWLTSFSYTFQIYFDFSGYTDMALGIALLFNIHLPKNFNSPYKAINIQDFWRRWHITLSTFLRDYIYIPLGGGRTQHAQTAYLNVLIVFIIGGIWHGASWMFLFWGISHGLAVVIYRLFVKTGLNFPNWLGWLITFIFINFSWILFRASDIYQARELIVSMFNFSNIRLPNFLQLFLPEISSSTIQYGAVLNTLGDVGSVPVVAAYFILAFIACLLAPNSGQLTAHFRPKLFTTVLTIALLICSLLKLSNPSDFLYFNF